MQERIKYTCKLGAGRYLKRNDGKIVCYIIADLIKGDVSKVPYEDFLPDGLHVDEGRLGEGKTPDSGSLEHGLIQLFSCPIKEWAPEPPKPTKEGEKEDGNKEDNKEDSKEI